MKRNQPDNLCTNEPTPLYTLGHGTRASEELLDLLERYGVQFVIDVRSHPYSRFKPEFSRPALERRLRQAHIRYVFMGDALGGRPSDETCYTNGKVDYAKVREKEFFQQGIARLGRAWEQGYRMTLLCSESKPEECHRSKLIGATLAEQGIRVMHIDENGVLKTQEQVMAALSGGQLPLFGSPPRAATSRKKYRAAQDEEEHDA